MYKIKTLETKEYTVNYTGLMHVHQGITRLKYNGAPELTSGEHKVTSLESNICFMFTLIFR